MRSYMLRLIAACLSWQLAAAPALAAAGPIEAAAQRALQQTTADEPALWKAMLQELDPGSLVAIRLKDGTRITGTVLRVDEDSVVFKPRTRIPEPARAVAVREIATVELSRVPMSPGKKVLIGTGIGVGAFFVLAAVLVAAYGYD